MSKKKTVDANGDLPVIERVPVDARKALRSSASLRPGPAMMMAAAEGNQEAQAIRDSWRFNFPIRTVSPEELADICDRGRVTFHG